MVRILRLHIAAEVADEFPGLFLFFPKLLEIRDSRPEILHILRFLVVPGDEIVGITGLVGNVPEQKPRFLPDRIVQAVEIPLAFDPAFRRPDGFCKRAKRLARHRLEFFLPGEEKCSEIHDRVRRNTVPVSRLHKILHIRKELLRIGFVHGVRQENPRAVQLKPLRIAHIALHDVMMVMAPEFAVVPRIGLGVIEAAKLRIINGFLHVSSDLTDFSDLTSL